MRVYLDIETNLAHDTIWMCATKKGDEVLVWRDAENLQEYLNGLVLVAHNGIGFDFHVLRTVWGIEIASELQRDTLVLSRLYNPELLPPDGSKAKPHSLEAWGIRLGDYKGGFTDFDAGYSKEMEEYCIQDVHVLEKLDLMLEQTMQELKFSEESIVIEHKVAQICKGMERNGFALNMEKAQVLLATLSGEMVDIETEFQTVFPPIITERISEKTGKKLKDKVTIFNPGSRKQIAERLLAKGVKLTKKTEKGSFIIDEKVLEGIDLPEAKIFGRYLMIQKRVAAVSSWLDLVGDDGRVHGRIITNGAVTGRATHNTPNMGQVPAVGKPYGAECRAMFGVASGMVQVGVDLSGIELRCLGHYLNDKEWIDELLKGDIHWFNAQSFGLVAKGTVKDDSNPEHKTARNRTKTLTYGVLYGAGAAKAGSIVGGNSTHGKRLIDSFVNNTPGLAALKTKISKFAKKGHLPGLDGRRVWIRSEHAALNTLLQSAGAIIAKQWLIECDRDLKAAGIPAKLMAWVHDEVQYETAPEYADTVKEIVEKAATKAGIVLQFRCPVDAEGKIGINWYETH
jgi:DNA polymerase I